MHKIWFLTFLFCLFCFFLESANHIVFANPLLTLAYIETDKNWQKNTVSTELLNKETGQKENTKNENQEIKKQKNLPRGVLAPAIQFNLDDYKDYFVLPSDYRVDLKSRNDYLITCEDEILGVNWGDLENIKVYDIDDKFLGGINKNSLIVKLRFETYSYIRLYKSSGEVVNIILSVNPIFEIKEKLSIGNCTIVPYRG